MQSDSQKTFSETQNQEEYVILIEDLYSQIDCYKVEHEKLKGELKLLINENKSLSSNVSELINSKIENLECKRDEKIENLKGQLEILNKEKTYTYGLWQNSIKITEQLEEELAMYRGGIHDFINKREIDKLKETHEKGQRVLQNKIDSILIDLESTKKSNSEALEEKNKELRIALKGHKESMDQIKDLQKQVIILTEKLHESEITIRGLQSTINVKKGTADQLKMNEYESKMKVAEAISIAEAAIMEKNNSVVKENEAKEEVAKLTKTIQELIKEAGEKVAKEVDLVKGECNKKIKEVYKDIKHLKEELNEKNLELEREIKKRKGIEEDLNKIRFGSHITEDEKNVKILHLEKNLESTFQKLILSERRVVQLTSERDSLRMDLEQVTQNFGRASVDNEKQKKELQLQIKTLRNELSNNNLIIDKYETTIKDLTIQADIVEQDLKHRLDSQNKLLSDSMEQRLRQIETEYFSEKNELQNYLKTELSLNKRWKIEIQDITTKFQTRIKELKMENRRLKMCIRKTTHVQENKE